LERSPTHFILVVFEETWFKWLTKIQFEVDFVNIGQPNGLNGLQRRLVHQLVRNEFPSCRTFARNSGEFMQVEKADPGKEVLVS
jgi:poly(A)-specific ribonuclease